MARLFQELIDYRGLLWAFTWRNIKIKYKQTFMGFLWAIFMPFVIVLSGVVVKFAMAKVVGKELELEQMASVMVKSLPWAFFIGSLKFTVGSLVMNMNILNKIYFPRVIFPLSYTIGQIFDLMIATVAFTFLFLFVDIGASINLLFVPILILFLVLLVAGLGMTLSCGNLFYRDVKYIVDVILTFAIFFTPVFYEASLFGKYETLLLINPVGAILESLNQAVVLKQVPDMFWFSYAGIVSTVSFVFGWIIFHKAEPTFSDNI